jgi:hypothetical protein
LLFDAEGLTSDGGGVLLGALDRGLGLTATLCACLEDRREAAKVRFSLLELVRQRVMSIALGYADGNDANRIREDPVVKALCGRDALAGDALAAQPTISRFENAFTAREMVSFSRKLEELSIGHIKRRHRKKPKLITVDADPTVDPTHGQQQLTFFSGHYDTWCYLPLLTFVSVDGSDQYLVSARLRPGNASAARCAVPTIRRVVRQLREKFPGVTIRVRLDGAYATPGVLSALDELGVQYLVAMGKNSVLAREAEPLMTRAREEAERSEETATLFGEFRYAAGTWSQERRIILKAEVVSHPGRELRDNPRFVITNLRHAPENAYGLYCGRGDPENRLKELKNDLQMDRTSCSSFLANQLRVLLTATAYLLYQELRWRLRRTELRRAQLGTLRERLMKIGARVVESVRRVVFHCPTSYPWAHLWRAAALAVGAIAT